MAQELRLWYKEPARKWANALPIGNGKFGAMVFGQVHKERWQLNEDSVWYGCPIDRHPKDALKHLPELRRLLDEGQPQEAEKLVERAFIAMPESQRHYETLGLVNLIFPHQETEATNYERYLDLNTATTGLSYEVNGVRYSRELFSSHPANVIAAEFTASEPGYVTFDLRIIRQAGMPIHDRPMLATDMDPEGVDTNIYMDSVTVVDNCLVMKARTGGDGVRMCLTATVTAQGGTVEAIGETIVVKNANKTNVLLAAETTFRYEDPEAVCLSTLKAAGSVDYEGLRKHHIEDYRSLFSRVNFRLGKESDTSKSTGELMELARKGMPSLSLTTLYFQYGRYLLISSSRPGDKALPSNLQGIWNEKMAPTWGSKFTINVNLEMNYWHAETANLSECHEPFFTLLESLEKNGRITARKMYDCGGWTAHHNTDIWGDSAPQDRCITATLWPMVGAWVSTHIWNHYEFTGDVQFLERFYSTLRGSVEFFLDFLIDKDGYKVTSPSLSPENMYRLPNGKEGTICIAPTMDRQLLFQLFSDYLNAAAVLKKSEDYEIIQKVQDYRSRLPPLRIGKYGQLQEWWEDHEEVEPGHRHFSHLWGLYPSDQITLADTAIIAACKKTLERRKAAGGGHTGWSRAWMIALWARLGDGDEALHHVGEILRSSTHDSLLDDHPPFQIDGNFGAAAGMVEMLVHSFGGEVILMPALPGAWSEGSIRGLCARGGFEVDMDWDGGLLTKCLVRSRLGNGCTLRARQKFVVTCRGSVIAQSASAGKAAQFRTEKGAEYEVIFT